MAERTTSQLTLVWVLIPLLATFFGQRLYFHLVNPNADAFVAGYNIHHLFTGVLIEIPAGIVLAFRIAGASETVFELFPEMAVARNVARSLSVPRMEMSIPLARFGLTSPGIKPGIRKSVPIGKGFRTVDSLRD